MSVMSTESDAETHFTKQQAVFSPLRGHLILKTDSCFWLIDNNAFSIKMKLSNAQVGEISPEGAADDE